MSWTPPKQDSTPSDHLIAKRWWESHEEIGEPHTSSQLEDWFNKNHECLNCGKIIRTHQQASIKCKEGK